jgi:hypothetical protein
MHCGDLTCWFKTSRTLITISNKSEKQLQTLMPGITAQTGDPLDLLRRMKFETIGSHPIEGHALNLVEQINQTWSYVVALAAARQLLELHPDVEGYQLAPGAHASIPLDIMSELKGCGRG